MPRSQQPEEGEKIVLDKILANPDSTVLDVGCGDGKWSWLTGKVKTVHGIEAWQNYVIKYDLESKYDKLFVEDVKDFEDFEDYDVVIFGDVLEHLEYEDALVVIDRLKASSVVAYLIIPISLCVQDGAFYGNPYETHRYQWKDEELTALGWVQLHEGTNPNGLVKIGTYVLDTTK
jgi:predicted TPR repeat methyltransferase